MSSTELATVSFEDAPAVISDTLSIDELVAEGQLITEVMSRVMQQGEHYGVIPGTQRPTLLKPGAEKLCRTFKLAPTYPADRLQRDYLDGDHYTVTAACVLVHRPTQMVVAEGLGQCTTKEEKYAFRGQQERFCPDCGVAAVVRSTKKEAYFCIRDKGGCGHRFAFGSDPAKKLDAQEVGKAANDRLPDTWNTVLKMACKRALIAAVLNGTAASDVFTQDVEDTAPAAATTAPPPRAEEPIFESGATAADEAVPVDEEAEERRHAIGALSAALKHAAENGSLPPGQENWADYTKEEMGRRYELKPEQDWRQALSAAQILDIAAWLAEQDIPL